MTLSLNVKGICEGAINAPGITKSSDWAIPSGDSSFPYDQSSYFSSLCTDVTPAPTYTLSTLDPKFTADFATKTVSWVISSFTADATFTVTVVGALQSPHTMTITQVFTMNIKSACTTLAYTQAQ